MKSKVELYTRALIKAASENKRLNREREELVRQKEQLIYEKEELLRENEELKRKTSSPAAVEKYFEIINARLENIQQGEYEKILYNSSLFSFFQKVCITEK